MAAAPDIAGKHLANPTAFLWSACWMLEYLGENEDRRTHPQGCGGGSAEAST